MMLFKYPTVIQRNTNKDNGAIYQRTQKEMERGNYTKRIITTTIKKPTSFSIADILKKDDDKIKKQYNYQSNYDHYKDSSLYQKTSKYCNHKISDIIWQSDSNQLACQNDEKTQSGSSAIVTSTGRNTDDQDETTLPRFHWLECTRYKPPKVARAKRKRGKTIRASRQPRVPFTPYQQSRLEDKFQNGHYLTSNDVSQLSASLDLPEQKVKIWFQNRRARERRDAQNCMEDNSANSST